MFEFPDLSDPDDSAIDDIISQAKDACVLEQVSAINCSGFTDSALPTDLESRFRKLKSFPVTKSKHNPNPKEKSESNSFSISPSKENKSLSVSSNFSDLKPQFSPPRENSSYRKKEMKEKPEHRSGSSDSSDGNPEFSPLRENSSYRKKEVKTTAKPKPKPKSASSSPLSSSPSPPRKIGCFLCSPKKDYSKSKKKKKSKENNNWAASENVIGGENSDELYLSSPSDLGSFSRKHQQKMLKKAIKEEQKIAREAEKIVQWAKQASARMSISDIGDDLSDD